MVPLFYFKKKLSRPDKTMTIIFICWCDSMVECCVRFLPDVTALFTSTFAFVLLSHPSSLRAGAGHVVDVRMKGIRDSVVDEEPY